MKSLKLLSVIGMTTLATLIGAAVIQGCGSGIHAAQTTEPYLHTARTLEVRMQESYLLEREFAGEIRAGQSSELGFELAGQVTELLVDEGEEIYAGQVLGNLDNKLLKAERNELNAQSAELQAELATTRRDLQRIESLQAGNLASERERDSLAGQVQVLEASVDRINALLKANDIRLEKSVLRAPFDSRIARRHIDSGMVVNAGAPVFSLVETGQNELRAGVPLQLAETLSPGDLVDVRVGQQLTTGLVVQVGAVVNRATRTRAVRVSVPENRAPGEIAYLRLGVAMEVAGSWLPDTAVTEGLRGTWVVYAAVPEGDGQAVLEARSVVIHHATADQLFVSGAVSEGDLVVSTGLHRFAPGQAVKPEPAGTETLAVAP
ncbi:MAG TPA: efflux RND transporter periplasmic adaptor subunit [Xanthomonadales bacterium]|nr:efflux RND transporter periplasmic adaptor subunit [Xanthomonadales bacterium]